MSSQNLSKEQTRNQKVLEIINSKGKVTLNDLAQGLNISVDQNFHGRKLRLILADLVYSKLLKVSTGRNPVYSLASAGKSKLAPKVVEVFDLQAELNAVSPVKVNKPATFGPGRKVAPIKPKESNIIPLTRPEPTIAPYPVIGNLATNPKSQPKSNVTPISPQVNSSEAFKIFESAFARDPDKTLDTLVKVVFEQQRKLDRQEKLIKGLYKLLGDYLAG